MAPAPKPWFRFYTEAAADRKLRRLKPEYRWLFVACLCAARSSPKPGFLMVGATPMGWDDVVDLAAMPLRSVERGTDALQDAGLLGRDPELDCWFIPSWDKRQFESDLSTPRVATARKRRSNPDKPLHQRPSNAPETEAETESPQPPAKRGANDCPSCHGDGELYSATAGRFGPCRCTFEPLKIAGSA